MFADSIIDILLFAVCLLRIRDFRFIVVAWGVIPWTTKYTFGILQYSSWNIFLTLCSLPSILLALWLTRFPESPKFLLECGEFDEALECLKRIYTENTGEPGDAYPVRRDFLNFLIT